MCATPRRSRRSSRTPGRRWSSIWPPRSTSATPSSDPDGGRDHQRAGHDRGARRRPRGGAERLVNTSTGGGLYGDADVLPTPEDHADPAAGPLRAEQVRRRGLLRALHPAARLLDGLAALRQRLRPPPGRPRRGRRGGDLLRPPGQRRRSRPCSATARQTRDWVDVSDVVRANLLAAESSVTGPVNIGHGRETSVLDLLAGAARCAPDAGRPGAAVRARAPGRGEAQLPGRHPRPARARLGAAGARCATGCGRSWPGCRTARRATGPIP